MSHRFADGLAVVLLTRPLTSISLSLLSLLLSKIRPSGVGDAFEACMCLRL